ncbi:MAG: hypothetical protein RR454_02985 [Clostridia bacterium]
MSIFSRKKFDKIKREEVVEAIIGLEKQEEDIIASFDESKKKIGELVAKGKRETDRNMQVAYAKKIESIQRENASASKRWQFVNSNLSAMYALKSAMDDREFIANNSKISLNDMLTNPKELEKFLSKTNVKKMQHEDKLAGSLGVIDTVNESYVENEKVYGVSDNMQNILAMFEADKTNEDNMAFAENNKIDEAKEDPISE